MTREDVIRRILNFMAHAFGGRQFGNEEDIVSLGFGSSLFAMQLVMFIEREFAIEIVGEDLQESNFRNVSAMAALVCRRLGGSAEDGLASTRV